MKTYFKIFHFCKNVYYYSATYGNCSNLKLTLHKRSNEKGVILTTKQDRSCDPMTSRRKSTLYVLFTPLQRIICRKCCSHELHIIVDIF